MDDDKSVVEKVTDAVKNLLNPAAREPEVGNKLKDKKNTTATADHTITKPASTGRLAPKANRAAKARAATSSTAKKTAKKSAPKTTAKKSKKAASKKSAKKSPARKLKKKSKR